jgi:hypothetical protein
MKAIISERINGGRFKMSDEIVALMQTFVQDSSWKAEAGGILIGRHILDTLDIVVDSHSAFFHPPNLFRRFRQLYLPEIALKQGPKL